LARSYVGAGRFEKARDAYLELVKLDSNNWDALFELGKTYASLGDTANARQRLSDLLKRNPTYTRRGEAEKILAGL
ncbi:MAG: tetratricopeptide repeat protein, partial [Treponemataceae bacterium]|nr:tetratricopeptide repeat protein [Treponemataceae bacterium]